MSDLINAPSAPSRPLPGDQRANPITVKLRLALRTWLTREALPGLSAQQLNDIGVSRAEALAEAARLPWDSATGRQRRRSARGVWARLRRQVEGERVRQLIVGARPDAVSWGG